MKIQVFDLSGRLVETLVNDNRNAGYYNISWHPENQSSGMYFYRISVQGTTNYYNTVKRCIYLK